MRRHRPRLESLALLAATSAVIAGPVTTVPWDGHTGAVTFTFDDGCPTHLTNVIPALDKRGIPGTFFLSGAPASPQKAQWIAAARRGHELGNHTSTHANLSGLDSTTISTEILDQARALRSLDPSVEALTLAYPYCATNTLVDSIAAQENLISRTCGGSARFAWGTRPRNWMQATSLIVQDSASGLDALAGIDAVTSTNSWLVTLNHGVGGDWLPAPTASVEAMFDRAIAKGAWIATYQQVAAYWRASAVMDTARAVVDASGWSLSWRLPWKRSPREVLLRVRFDSTVFGKDFVVAQDGHGVSPESDGSFRIDFLKGTLRVERSLSSSTTPRGDRVRFGLERRGGVLELRDTPPEAAGYRIVGLDGQILAQGRIVARGASATLPVGGGLVAVASLVAEDGTSIASRLLPPAFAPGR